MDWILLLHGAATLFMTGLIWFVQVVHYPLFRDAGREGFRDYERRHAHLTGRVVGAPMLLEVATAILLLFGAPEGFSAWAWGGFLLLVLIWGSTVLLQVPCHRALEQGFDPAIHRRLVRSNWIRTAAWSARSLIALHLLLHPEGN